MKNETANKRALDALEKFWLREPKPDLVPTILSGKVPLKIEVTQEQAAQKAERAKVAELAQRAAHDAFLALPDQERWLTRVLAGISKLKSLGAEDALKQVRRELNRKGGMRGPNIAESAARWKIEALSKLADDATWPEAMAHYSRMDVAVAKNEIGKYCLALYEVFRVLKLADPNNRIQDNPDSWWIIETLELEFGFTLPQDASAMVEALRRGKRQYASRSSRSTPTRFKK